MESDEFTGISDLLPEHKPKYDSVILYSRGKVYSRSGAALRIAWKLRFPIPLVSIVFILPPFIRNGIYNWIARNRYRWFGKRNTCFIPDGLLKSRFLS
jgi:predicted DCC family thiol-disulfide oxidoreductase YuxK